MPLLNTSGSATADGYGGGVAAVPNYIEDVFSTYLFTGNSTTNNIVNGIDLSTKGGLVWTKSRSNALTGAFYDSAIGLNKYLIPSSTAAAGANTGVTFNTNGFTVGANDNANSTTSAASWTFRKQPKFFDVVTYTGDGISGRLVSHNLGSTPGCVIIKRTDAVENWAVNHRGDGTGNAWTGFSLNSNGVGSQGVSQSYVTSTTVSVTDVVGNGSSPNGCNTNGASYVMYLFANNAGGFGLTNTDNVISCGSYTGNGSTTGPIVNLGYEPQWLMVKNATGNGNWNIVDVMRGFALNYRANLTANSTAIESTSTTVTVIPTATGFSIVNVGTDWNTLNNAYIYIAIRRGPMKVPTDGTTVFSPNASGGSTGTAVTTGFPIDLQVNSARGGTYGAYWNDRLRGVSTNSTSFSVPLRSTDTGAEQTTGAAGTLMFGNTGFQVSSDWAVNSQIYWNFKRAPGFFDEVCYTGTGSNPNTQSHNLAVIPEFVIYKRRNSTGDWETAVKTAAGTYTQQSLNGSGASYGTLANATAAGLTSTTFNPHALGSGVNVSGGTYVAYLFATCAGVSKVGSYSGTGATQTIDCGFTGGARWVMLKRTDSTGDWYVWDTARGMVSGNDRSLLMNSTAAEVNTNSVYTTTGGFQIVSTAADINTNGGTYIYLAIA